MGQGRIKIVICFMICSIFSIKDSQSIKNEDAKWKWLGPPSKHSNYEKYIKEEVQAVDTYNYQQTPAKMLRKRETIVQIKPNILKFGVEDAREPDEATKELIRKHRARELKERNVNVTLQLLNRRKRGAPKTEPRFINFEVSDAREPDDITKELIRQNRARELGIKFDQLHVTSTRSQRKSIKKVTHKQKRTRRSAQITQPHFIKFELADAKEPDQNIRGMIQSMRSFESKPSSINHVSNYQSNKTVNTNDSVVDESKKIFLYQAVPLKSKRIANALPIEVKKIIDLMIRDSKAQAYYKYITANHEAKLKTLDKVRPFYGAALAPQLPVPVAENLVTIYPEPAYVQKLVPIPIQTNHVNALPTQSIQNPASPASYPAIVPVSTHSQKFYQPLAPFPQTQPGTSIYEQPATYLKVIPAMTQVFKNIPIEPAVPQQQILPQISPNSVVNNEILKPYPYAKIIPLDTSYRYGKMANFYPMVEDQQAIRAQDKSSQNGSGGDLPNQSQQNLLSQKNINKEQTQVALKDNQEFQELSSLIGKSPSDQIHGLAYLLAKEMQRNKRLKEQPPQENTSPILFHPEKNVGVSNAVSQQSEEIPFQPNLFPHPLPQSLPQDDADVNHIIKDNPEANTAPPPPSTPPTSYNVVKHLGLSPNYEGIDHFDEAPKLQPDVEDGLGLQYASKYAFGYRVRDFYSGNDFGHKQNRDLDGVTRGQYHILLPDGRVQNVIYHADDTGFHADVSFETGHH